MTIEEIDKIEKELKIKDLSQPIQLRVGEIVENPKKTVESLLKYCKNNVDRKSRTSRFQTFKPYFDKLVRINEML